MTLEAKKDAVDTKNVISDAVQKNEKAVKEQYEEKGTFAAGYGGKFGVQADRMDGVGSLASAIFCYRLDRADPRYVFCSRHRIISKNWLFDFELDRGERTDSSAAPEGFQSSAELDFRLGGSPLPAIAMFIICFVTSGFDLRPQSLLQAEESD